MPLSGETLFDSEKHIDLPPQKRRVGYLFRQHALFPNMTVLQNIWCGIRSGSRAEKRRRAEEKLRRFILTLRRTAAAHGALTRRSCA